MLGGLWVLGVFCGEEGEHGRDVWAAEDALKDDVLHLELLL